MGRIWGGVERVGGGEDSGVDRGIGEKIDM